MQNFDFHERKNSRPFEQKFDTYDPEFFTRESVHEKEEERHKKKASGILFLVIALCIICFTTGLALGIKYSGGNRKDIVDESTMKAVSGIGQKAAGIISGKQDDAPEKEKKPSYPKEEYPFVIKVGHDYDKQQCQKIAEFLSAKGHQVIVSKTNSSYRLFAGPYKTQPEAKSAMNKISGYEEFSLSSRTKILKRQ